nr:WPE palindromic element domain-containing protein [Wolbachia endosymbiont (group A) of Anomoia purmunda]
MQVASPPVIPVPRHWDPGNLISTKWLHNKG